MSEKSKPLHFIIGNGLDSHIEIEYDKSDKTALCYSLVILVMV